MNLTITGRKYDTTVGNMMKKDSTKRQGYIDPHALINTRNFITVIVFPGLVQRLGLSL